MRAYNVYHCAVAQDATRPSSLVALSVHEVGRDMPGTLIPHLETQIVVRFGPKLRGGLDAHALGARQHVHRKLVDGGQRIVVARLRLGTHEAVFGMPASSMAGHTVALEDLWDDSAGMFDRLASAPSMVEAATTLERAISERLRSAPGPTAQQRFALEAARRLERDTVDNVASDLGVSARHLRRVFRKEVGASPKAFARLARFHRALRDARRVGGAGWASIAAVAGYYDQAHLVAEFRAIAGVTPRTLITELQASLGTE